MWLWIWSIYYEIWLTTFSMNLLIVVEMKLLIQNGTNLYLFDYYHFEFAILAYFSYIRRWLLHFSQRLLVYIGTWRLSFFLLQWTRFIWFIFKKWIIINEVERKRKLFRKPKKWYKETMQYVGTRLICHK